MLEDSSREVSLDTSEGAKPNSATIHYSYSRFEINGRIYHSANVTYGYEPNRGAQLAEARFVDGKPKSVSMKYGTKEDLLNEYLRSLQRRRVGFGGHGPALYPTHRAVCFVPNGEQVDIYNDQDPHLGSQVGTVRYGENFNHESIPYTLEVVGIDQQIQFRRISQDNNSAWEFIIPNEISLTGSGVIPISFLPLK